MPSKMKAESTPAPGCVHSWTIESSNGRRESPGRCGKCGAVGSFANSIGEADRVWRKSSRE